MGSGTIQIENFKINEHDVHEHIKVSFSIQGAPSRIFNGESFECAAQFHSLWSKVM